MENNINLLNNTPTKNKADIIDLSDIFWRYFRHWRWILFSIIVALILGFFFGKMQTEVYQVEASVLIKSPAKEESALLKDLGVETNSNIENEVEVFRSKRLLNRVVDTLGLNVSYYYKAVLNNLTELYNFSPIKVSVSKSFLANLGNGTVQLTIKQTGEIISVDGVCKNVAFSKSFNDMQMIISTPFGGILLIKKKRDIELSRPLIVVIQGSNAIISNMAVQASINKKNQIIALSTLSFTPQKGIDVLNKVIDSYNEDAMGQMNQSSINTANFIAERIRLLTIELSDVEKKVEDYRRNNKFSDINAQSSTYLNKSILLEDRNIEQETQFQLLGFVEDFITNDKNQYSPFPNIPLTDQGLSGNLEKYNQLLLKRTKVLESSSTESPVFETLNKEISTLRKSILSMLRNARKVMQLHQQEIQRMNSITDEKLDEIPRQEREFVELKRQQKIKEQLYVFLLQKREESALTMALTLPKAIIINEAGVTGLVSANRNTILMYCFIFGFFFPLVIIYLLNFFNTKIFVRRDVEHLTPLPIISEMAHSESIESFAVTETGMDSTTELFRLLRTKLNFILEQPREKIILVTSTEPGEGKTFISSNLALGLAMTDKKVLLIGLDLRKPQLSEKFGITQKEGITSILSHQETDVNSLIFVSPDYPNLSVLHSGIVPPNPNELLMKDELKNLFTYFREKYDYIILDSAPIGVVSDSLLLLKYADITLYVCRSGFTDKKSFDVINRLSEEDPSTRLYLILNDLSFRHKYYKYRYRYGYGYGYGYGASSKTSNDKDKK